MANRPLPPDTELEAAVDALLAGGQLQAWLPSAADAAGGREPGRIDGSNVWVAEELIMGADDWTDKSAHFDGGNVWVAADLLDRGLGDDCDKDWCKRGMIDGGNVWVAADLLVGGPGADCDPKRGCRVEGMIDGGSVVVVDDLLP